MQPVLFDSSIYVPALRRGETAILALRRWAPSSPVWLSSVVLEELYAGVKSRDRKAVEQLEYDFDRVKRILVPELTDWTQTGKVLARLAQSYGYEQLGKARLTNDALIAISAIRIGAKIFTANKRDFAKLAEFKPFLWQVVTFDSL